MILDSNIVIYATMPEHDQLRRYLNEHQDELMVSSITQLEVLGYHRLTVQEKILLEGLFSTFRIIPISSAIISKAIELRQTQKMSVGDVVIAGTAILNAQVLLTNNVKDFVQIKDLEVLDLQALTSIS